MSWSGWRRFETRARPIVSTTTQRWTGRTVQRSSSVGLHSGAVVSISAGSRDPRRRSHRFPTSTVPPRVRSAPSIAMDRVAGRGVRSLASEGPQTARPLTEGPPLAARITYEVLQRTAASAASAAAIQAPPTVPGAGSPKRGGRFARSKKGPRSTVPTAVTCARGSALRFASGR